MAAPVDISINHERLRRLSRDVPALVRELDPEGGAGLDRWHGVLDRKLIPRLQPDLPLLAAVCGGGSSGKSSLFNALVGRRVSPVGGKAGINRRVLVAADPAYFEQQESLAAIFEPFGAPPRPLADPEELTTVGEPLYVAAERMPADLALMDTPDFDTGAGGAYTNREVARQALEASDILVYLFTNSNYSNRDNSDFVAEMLTGIGLRKCFLVYRVYPSFRETEVLEHAMTVARNIYGEAADANVLGIYRADEDNRVAAGERFLTLRPARPDDPPFEEALKAVDTRKLRLDLNASILEDALAMAAAATAKAAAGMDALRLYRDALTAAEGRCTQTALRHFPMDRVMRRFSEIWLASDPPHIRAMRRTGSTLEWPVKAAAGLLRRLKSSPDNASAPRGEDHYAEMVREDLVGAASELHLGVVGSAVTVKLAAADPAAKRMAETAGRVLNAESPAGVPPPRVAPENGDGETTFTVAAHPAVLAERERLRGQDWPSILGSILDRRDVIVTLSEQVEAELRVLADDFRRRMGVWDKIRHSFSAFLNVIPATAAVTYILHTGDPAGAVGIKVKLSGIFGLQDLYALIAIPASSGMKKADRRQLETMLAPIARTWLSHKTEAVQRLLRQEITGGVLEAAERVLADAERRVARIADDLSHVSRWKRRHGD